MRLASALSLLVSVAWSEATAGTTSCDAEKSSDRLVLRSCPTSITTTIPRPLVQTLFIPLFDATNLAASVVSAQSALITYAVNYAASAGSSDVITFTEGPGTFVVTLTGTNTSLTGPPLVPSNTVLSTPASATGSSVTATTISCTLRGPLAANPPYIFSQSFPPTSTRAIDFSSIPIYAATAVCTTRSAIEGLGIAASTTTLFGTELQRYASATVTITAGAAKLSLAPNQTDGARGGKPSGANQLLIDVGLTIIWIVGAAFVGALTVLDFA